MTRLRNRISNVLFEHKENMESGTYKILYETLQAETKSDPAEKVLVTITYMKATVIQTRDADGDDVSYPWIKEHSRNLFIAKEEYETAQTVLREKRSYHLSEMFSCRGDLERWNYFKTQMDEEYILAGEEAQIRIIAVKLLE